jgi:anaerobic sulfite reductase subunit C
MKWTPEAEKAIKKVPFFVRKKVRLRVENEARDKGKNRITPDDVKATKAAYLSNMSSEVKGYQIDTCFGSEGCQNRANKSDRMVEKIGDIFRDEDLLSFLKERVLGDLKPHHEFRVSVADCPNACSQPQIKDIGIIGACLPEITDKDCSRRNLCVDSCREKAILIDDDLHKPSIDFDLCLKCGQCIDVCSTGTIEKGQTGFRVQLGGKLGRHPRLARELPGIYAEEQVIEIVKACIKFYKENSKYGERFSEIFKATDFEGLSSRFTPHSYPL